MSLSTFNCHLTQRFGGEWSWIIHEKVGDSPNSSVGKESACNAEDPGSIPGLGGSVGEGIGNPLHYSWASLVAQLVKNLPMMQETLIKFLGQEDLLEKG